MKLAKLAAILLLLYVAIPTILLSKNFSPPETWNFESAVQFLVGVLLFGVVPHSFACIGLFIMMASKGIHSMSGLRWHKVVLLPAIFVLIAHWGMAILMGGKPVEFGMLVNFFLVPLMGGVSIVLGIIIGKII